ncbi:MAG: hypothetical protein OZSIB_4111 [Candidatus Ozemobacter sibiricus]|jgi:hypothetical protein|uniref:Uncharacterized protein n=1 Tax=Candidatus Ozemobacter sibiricus TaxID=2268124 RepID=A0A367ZPG6_9BACT|nr:MAG: hypothetical protein OZSIB_4111 [Candidatus Ozemobacter sibiricus]
MPVSRTSGSFDVAGAAVDPTPGDRCLPFSWQAMATAA